MREMQEFLSFSVNNVFVCLWVWVPVLLIVEIGFANGLSGRETKKLLVFYAAVFTCILASAVVGCVVGMFLNKTAGMQSGIIAGVIAGTLVGRRAGRFAVDEYPQGIVGGVACILTGSLTGIFAGAQKYESVMWLCMLLLISMIVSLVVARIMIFLMKRMEIIIRFREEFD